MQQRLTGEDLGGLRLQRWLDARRVLAPRVAPPGADDVARTPAPDSLTAASAGPSLRFLAPIPLNEVAQRETLAGPTWSSAAAPANEQATTHGAIERSKASTGARPPVGAHTSTVDAVDAALPNEPLAEAGGMRPASAQTPLARQPGAAPDRRADASRAARNADPAAVPPSPALSRTSAEPPAAVVAQPSAQAPELPESAIRPIQPVTPPLQQPHAAIAPPGAVSEVEPQPESARAPSARLQPPAPRLTRSDDARHDLASPESDVPKASSESAFAADGSPLDAPVVRRSVRPDEPVRARDVVSAPAPASEAVGSQPGPVASAGAQLEVVGEPRADAQPPAPAPARPAYQTPPLAQAEPLVPQSALLPAAEHPFSERGQSEAARPKPDGIEDRGEDRLAVQSAAETTELGDNLREIPASDTSATLTVPSAATASSATPGVSGFQVPTEATSPSAAEVEAEAPIAPSTSSQAIAIEVRMPSARRRQALQEALARRKAEEAVVPDLGPVENLPSWMAERITRARGETVPDSGESSNGPDPDPDPVPADRLSNLAAALGILRDASRDAHVTTVTPDRHATITDVTRRDATGRASEALSGGDQLAAPAVVPDAPFVGWPPQGSPQSSSSQGSPPQSSSSQGSPPQGSPQRGATEASAQPGLGAGSPAQPRPHSQAVDIGQAADAYSQSGAPIPGEGAQLARPEDTAGPAGAAGTQNVGHGADITGPPTRLTLIDPGGPESDVLERSAGLVGSPDIGGRASDVLEGSAGLVRSAGGAGQASARSQPPQPAQVRQPAPPLQPPSPLPESTRRFLRPLVGFDPSAARIHTADAGQLPVGVDAATVGRDVLLAPGRGGNSPEALGLLAHELTHVAHGGASSSGVAAGTPARRAANDDATEPEGQASGPADHGDGGGSGVSPPHPAHGAQGPAYGSAHPAHDMAGPTLGPPEPAHSVAESTHGEPGPAHGVADPARGAPTGQAGATPAAASMAAADQAGAAPAQVSVPAAAGHADHSGGELHAQQVETMVIATARALRDQAGQGPLRTAGAPDLAVLGDAAAGLRAVSPPAVAGTAADPRAEAVQTGVESARPAAVRQAGQAAMSQVGQAEMSQAGRTQGEALAEPHAGAHAATYAEPIDAKTAQSSAAGARDADPWGGLPAPWEPLPAWMSNAFSPVGPRADGTGDPFSSATSDPTQKSPVASPAASAVDGASNGASNGAAGAISAASGGGGQVFFADATRTLPTAASTETGAAPQAQEQAAAVEPDLDVLARQVYTILRNRLAAERRRLG